MGAKSKRSKGFNAERLFGNGSGNDAEGSGGISCSKINKVRYNSSGRIWGKQKLLRSRNNVDPNNRQQKYCSPNQNN